MKKSNFQISVTIFFVLLTIYILTGCTQKCSQEEQNDFQFVFLTDIHLQQEKNAVEGFKQAIDTVNKLNPDFVITGGDLIMDALGQTYGRADSLYNLYNEVSKDFEMPLYNTLGNHEIYGIYKSSDADKTHPEYGEKMFEKRLGKSYYAFDHKGWKFMIINSVEDTKRNGYIGLIDEEQIEWIKEELQKTDSTTPIVISTHIPFITVYNQIYSGSTVQNDSSLVVSNSKEVIDLFKDHNLKLVLQGHLHTVEDINVDGIHFITGGAVSAKWWSGANRGFEEGFVLISVKGDNFDWQYVDYGWNVEK
ncbi:MAG: metallophosphoesterase [Melioribacteraceae bacterium]|nr:metallophosphoesterase [Melioribacteraceae bacterium]